MAHWDFLADNARVAEMQPGPRGLHPYLDNLVRLSKLPVATISEIRGRTRGAGSEFVLATDIRFASERAVLGQFEVGADAVPGGGPMSSPGPLVGRGRALEILLGGDSISAGLAAEYDHEGFTDAFARRIPAFEKWASPHQEAGRRCHPARGRRVRAWARGVLRHRRPPGEPAVRPASAQERPARGSRHSQRSRDGRIPVGSGDRRETTVATDRS